MDDRLAVLISFIAGFAIVGLVFLLFQYLDTV